MARSKANGARPAGRRVYVQVHSPKTGRSTTVTLPWVYDGGVEAREVMTPSGKRVVGVVLPLAKGQRGLVPIDPSVFAAGRRQSVALAAKTHKAWVGAAPAEAPAKSAKGAPVSRKPAKASKPVPKGRSGRKAVSATPAAPASKGPRKAASTPPASRSAPSGSSASTDLTDAAAGSGDAGAGIPAGA